MFQLVGCLRYCINDTTYFGGNYRPKHVEPIEIITKFLLLLLVGYLYYCTLLWYVRCCSLTCTYGSIGVRITTLRKEAEGSLGMVVI
jgi:hypothetical protein